MKKTDILLIFIFFIVIPLTIYFLGAHYYIAAVLIIAELCLPYLLSFKKLKPPSGEMIALFVMCALAVIGRLAIPIPNFKAAYAVIMLAGIGFGAPAGFIVGAVTALVSNFFLGQGAYMPWQMLGYGAGGMLAGFVFAKNRVRPSRVVLGFFGFCSVVLWIGPILDVAHLFVMMPDTTLNSAMSSFLSGLPVNITQGVATTLILILLGRTVLEKLERIRLKYSVSEDIYGV